MKIKDVYINYRKFDPHADAYLVYGRVLLKNTLKNHVVGWQLRRGDDRLLDPHYFLDEQSAARFYTDTISSDYQPERKKLEKDWQQETLYRWEEDTLESYLVTLNKNEIADLVRQVANDHGIKTPAITWRKEDDYSEYRPTSHTIAFGHRDNISTLHEMAHALQEYTHDRRNVAHHAPGFVWIAIELYHKYAGVPLNTLITTANKYDLLGDLEADQTPLRLPRKKARKNTSQGQDKTSSILR